MDIKGINLKDISLDLSQFMKPKRTRAKKIQEIISLETLLVQNELIDSDTKVEGLRSCNHDYYKHKKILYGCDKNLIVPVQFGNVIGLVCNHRDGNKYFTRNTMLEAYKAAVRIR